MAEEEKNQKEDETQQTDEPIAPLQSIEHQQAGAEEPGVDRAPGKVYETQYGPGHTTDPQLAAEQGLTYAPPEDAPVVPSDDLQGAEIAAGFATDEGQPPVEADTLPAEVVEADLKLRQQIYEALRNERATAHLTDIAIDVVANVVHLRGRVHRQEEIDRVFAIANQVAGPLQVRNHLEIAE